MLVLFSCGSFGVAHQIGKMVEVEMLFSWDLGASVSEVSEYKHRLARPFSPGSGVQASFIVYRFALVSFQTLFSLVLDLYRSPPRLSRSLAASTYHRLPSHTHPQAS